MTASRAGVLVVAASLLASEARGADAVVEGVRVAAPACPIAPLSVPAFVDSLRVELAGRARAPGTTLVTLAIEPCDTATTRVRVAITNDAGAAEVEREVGLEDIAVDARPRALALAVAELVRGTQGPTAPPAPPPVAAATTPLTREPASSTSFAADALVSLYPNRDTVLGGARLSASIDRPRWSLAFFGEGALGEHGYDVGDVDLQSFGAGVVAGPRWSSGRFTLSPAVVGALGWARVQGHAGAPGVVAGSGSGLTAALRARLAASSIFVRVVSVRAFLEGGWMARGFDATVDGARAAGVSGATLVVGVGLGL
jgi:hypothetical protein